MCWDPSQCSESITIQGATLTRNGTDNYNFRAARGTVPNVPSFKVRLVKDAGAGPMIGYVSSAFKKEGDNYDSTGWFLYFLNGELRCKGTDDKSYHDSAIKPGAEVEAHFNADNREISFTVDGAHRGVAFTLPADAGDVWPCIEMHLVGAVVEAIQVVDASPMPIAQVPCFILSYLILSYPTLSYLLLSVSYLFLSYPILSYRI